MRQMEKFSEKGNLPGRYPEKGPLYFPAHCQFAYPLPYLLAHLSTENLRGYLLFYFILFFRDSLFPYCSQYGWVGICPARVSMWPRSKWINTPSLASCGDWFKTKHMIQLESDSYSEFFAKNAEKRREELLFPFCHQEGQLWVWKWNQSGRKPAWEPWIQLCLKVAHHWTLQLREPINYIFT